MTSPSSARGHPLLTAAAIDQLAEKRFEHPINPKGRRHSRALGDATGLEQIGVQLVRIAPGDETTEHHFHHFEEEFIYVLAGRGLAEIGEESHEVGPGDFMGFGPNSLAHSLSNPHEEDLVYLLGGTRPVFDVCDYPRAKKRLYVWRDEEHLVDLPTDGEVD